MGQRKTCLGHVVAIGAIAILGRFACAGDIQITSSESMGRTTTYSYDSTGTTSQSTTGNTTTYSYDSNSQNVYGITPNTTTYTYQAVGSVGSNGRVESAAASGARRNAARNGNTKPRIYLRGSELRFWRD